MSPYTASFANVFALLVRIWCWNSKIPSVALVSVQQMFLLTELVYEQVKLKKKCDNLLGFCCVHKLFHFIHTTFIILIFQWGTRLRKINNVSKVAEAEEQARGPAANLSAPLRLTSMSKLWDSGQGTDVWGSDQTLEVSFSWTRLTGTRDFV